MPNLKLVDLSIAGLLVFFYHNVHLVNDFLKVGSTGVVVVVDT